MGKFKGHPCNVGGVLVRRWSCWSQMPLSMPVDWISHKWGIFFTPLIRPSIHSSIRPSIHSSIHSSIHLQVFSTSQRSAGTLCPLKSTKKYRSVKCNGKSKYLNNLCLCINCQIWQFHSLAAGNSRWKNVVYIYINTEEARLLTEKVWVENVFSAPDPCFWW